jgi:hypothetical protein
VAVCERTEPVCGHGQFLTDDGRRRAVWDLPRVCSTSGPRRNSIILSALKMPPVPGHAGTSSVMSPSAIRIDTV